MRRQTLLLLGVFLVASLPMLVPAFLIQRQVQAASHPAARQRVPFGAVSLELPEGCERPARAEGAWTAREFQTALGVFRLATEPARGAGFPETCAAWFQMPGYTPGPRVYERGDYTWFFKEVRLFGRSAYVMRKRGKTVSLIAFFEQKGVWHWAMLTTRTPFQPTLEAFHRSLASMSLPDGEGPDPAFLPAVRNVAWEGRFRFIQPMALLFLIPGAVLAILLTVILWVSGRGGRLPRLEARAGRSFQFLEGAFELAIIRSVQFQLMNAALGLDDENLTVFTFGTPLLVIPRGTYAGRTRVGSGWFGSRFLELELDGALDFRKYRWKYGAWRGRTRLRIYTQDPLRLQMALG